MIGTSTLLDALMLVIVLSVATVGALATWLAGELAPCRPALPAADCAPPGASRLVPAGLELELEAGRGIRALELWLDARRRRP